MTNTFKSILISAVALAPSLLWWWYWAHNRAATLPHTNLIADGILLWAALDFIIVVCIEPYRRRLGRLTIPSFLGAIAVVFLYLATEGLSRFFDRFVGYGYLTPIVMAVAALLCVAVLIEKNTPMKAYLSLNVFMLAVLWELGVTDKVMMPF